ncbi:hypothetical protein C8Q79DRAFT_982350 [Trametes meyenii]|nr:hypothetical protein C8Q79DRAFT_982350 [Trametes meyenii]
MVRMAYARRLHAHVRPEADRDRRHLHSQSVILVWQGWSASILMSATIYPSPSRATPLTYFSFLPPPLPHTIPTYLPAHIPTYLTHPTYPRP